MTRFWAKTGTEADGEYLPLERHLADAAAMAGWLWRFTLAPAQREWLARGLKTDVEGAGKWLAFVAGAHDVGKASWEFQTKAPWLAEELLSPELKGARPRRTTNSHDAVSGAALARWLMNRGASRRDAAHHAAAISGHHATPRESELVARAGRDQVEPWGGEQQALLDDLASLTGVDEKALPSAPPPAITIAIAGFVSVADWLASDATRFPVTAEPGRTPSEGLVDMAMDRGSWSVPAIAPATPLTLSLGSALPRAMQQAVLDFLSSWNGAPSLFLIEDRTGSGKTEAALMIAQRALVSSARGFYIGMPTQATASQLHLRASKLTRQLWPDVGDPQLLHGGFREHADLPKPQGVGDDVGLDVDAEMWFRQSARRGLIAPLGVGTIDQALLSILNARLYQVRLFGLFGKVVILDEVHAYDAYTGSLLDSLLTYLAELGSTVILLSATLPAGTRQRLIQAYAEGLESQPGSGLQAVTHPSYPRLTVASSADCETIEVVDRRPGRRVALESISLSDGPGAIARRACARVQDGGCLGIVCNTVAEAQEQYLAVREACMGTSIETRLFHARMRQLERRPIEEGLVEALGPDSSCEDGTRPERLIVVATQVIEQSLDLDFDHLFTHLAPIDLLIQRAGRIHRHSGRPRPINCVEPSMTIIDHSGTSPTREMSAPSVAVYGEYLLARTRLALEERSELCEPDDLDELIEAVYGDAELDCGADERVKFRAFQEGEASRTREMELWARRYGLKRPSDDEPPWDRGLDPLNDLDDPGEMGRRTSAPTRYSERASISAVLLFPGELDASRKNPSRADTGELLKRSVNLSAPSIVQPLLAGFRADNEAIRPPAWMRNSRLRFHLLVELDETGAAKVEKLGSVLPMRLDRELGVVIDERGRSDV